MASANQPAESFPAPVEIIRKFQAANGTVVRRPQPGDRVGFAFSTMDRPSFTQQTLEALDAEGDFDIIWNDGSRESAVPALARVGASGMPAWWSSTSRSAAGRCRHPLRLKRLLDRGYDYIGLIENDVVLEPGWFVFFTNLFSLAADEGLVCGAASVRGFASRVLEYRNGYALDWASSAGNAYFFSRRCRATAVRQLFPADYGQPQVGRILCRKFRH